jgi:hypothetical protein
MAVFKRSASVPAIIVIAAFSLCGGAQADSNDPPAADRQAEKNVDKKPDQAEKKSDQNEKKSDSADNKADQAAKKPDGAEKKSADAAASLLLNPLYERGFIRDFVTRLRGDVEKLSAVEKPEQRQEAQAKIIKSYGDELHGKTLTFHFPVRDIDRPSDRYVIKLDTPRELDASVGQLRFLQQVTFAYSSLPAYDPRLIRPRDTVEISGTARLVYDTSTTSSGTQQSVPALFLGPDVYGKFYGVYLDNCQTRIEHQPH